MHPPTARPARRSLRRPGFDYAFPGGYFVTVVTDRRRYLFGRIHDGVLAPSPFGRVVQSCWNAIPAHCPWVDLDAFVLMPNHVHGVLLFQDTGERARQASPLRPRAARGVEPGSLGAVVGGFKSAATRRINQMRRTPGACVWQRNYYEHVIRNEDDLSAIRRYIVENTLCWGDDPERPGARSP